LLARWTTSRARIKRDRLTAFIDSPCRLEGQFKFTGTVLLNAAVTGSIVSEDILILGKTATIEGLIQARIVQIAGEVTGTVVATERLELRPDARVRGEVQAPVFVIEAGAVFAGQSRMPDQGSLETPAAVTVTRDAERALTPGLEQPLT
jgi:cytoskeletal protein CcmA (bactofilin family)